MATETNLTSERITAAVRAEVARRGLSGNDLIQPLGLSRNAVYRRLRGDYPFDTEELSRIVAFLGIGMDTLFASAALGVAERAA